MASDNVKSKKKIKTNLNGGEAKHYLITKTRGVWPLTGKIYSQR